MAATHFAIRESPDTIAVVRAARTLKRLLKKHRVKRNFCDCDACLGEDIARWAEDLEQGGTDCGSGE